MPARPQHHLICSNFKVYFPKFVTINNPRLGCLYWVVMFVTMSIAIYQFVADKRSLIEKLPDGDVQVCAQLCQKTQPQLVAAYQGTDSSFCNNADYNYAPYGYSNLPCSSACTPSSSGPCMTSDQAVQIGASSIFVPTFFTEMTQAVPEIVASSCSGGVEGSTAVDGVCTKTSHHFVPGVENMEISFQHKYQVPLPTSSILGSQPDELGNSMDELPTTIINAKGEEMKTFAAKEKISFTVKEILENAWLDDIGEADNQGPIDLNQKYSSPSEGISGNPSLRLTGMTVAVDLFYTNSGGCRLNLGSPLLSPGPATIACGIFKVTRKWTSKYESSMVTIDGDRVSRKYNGIQFEFHVEGSFKFIDWSRVFKGLTTILIWMQIPIWILYFFSIIFLGQLSAIYNRVIHQEMTLQDAIVGLAARLISHSSAFSDVQDQPGGISRNRILERFSLIMQYNEDLDDAEVQKFVDFVYKSLASAGGIEAGQTAATAADLISVQDFCAACSSSEPLTFDALVQIFDRSRELSAFEGIFNDVTCARVRNSQSQREVMESVSSSSFKYAGNRMSQQLGAQSKHILDIPARYEELNRATAEATNDCTKLISKHGKLAKYVSEAEDQLKVLDPSGLGLN